MARKPRGEQAANQADFANPNAQLDEIEKLARLNADANAKIGHNSGPSVDAIKRVGLSIETALAEIDAAGRILQKARQSLSAAEKTGKTELGSAQWVAAVKSVVKLKRQGDKAGFGPIVTEQRQIGTVMKALDVPLYTQFGLFHFPEEEAPAPGESKSVSEADAYLLGEQSYRDGVSKEGNTFDPGTANHVQWDRGWSDAFDRNIDGIGGKPGDGGSSPGATEH